MNEVERPVCRTCLKPKEPLVNEGGLLFCQGCLENYKALWDWIKSGEQYVVSYEQFMAEYQVPYLPTNSIPYPRQTNGDLDVIPEEIEKARRDFLGF